MQPDSCTLPICSTDQKVPKYEKEKEKKNQENNTFCIDFYQVATGNTVPLEK